MIIAVSRGTLNNNAGDHRATIMFEQDNVMAGHTNTTSRHNLVEKIKMAFSNEKRKSRRSHSQSDTSSSDEETSDFDGGPLSSRASSTPHHLQPILSRQSTQYNSLAEIIEEPGSNSGY